jgi:hypothetical protein
MPAAAGSAEIYRYASDGGFAGDTSHESKVDAEEQLEFEYGSAVGPWKEVPPDVADAHAYAIEQAGNRTA